MGCIVESKFKHEYTLGTQLRRMLGRLIQNLRVGTRGAPLGSGQQRPSFQDLVRPKQYFYFGPLCTTNIYVQVFGRGLVRVSAD